MKKPLIIVFTIFVMGVFLVGCGEDSSSGNAPSYKDEYINVISREDGSGTRGAFIELFAILEKKSDGTKKDRTTKEATVVSSTDVVMKDVSNDPYAIGYVSLGSINDTVKTLQIDGVDATEENVKDGTYKISRPFNIVTKKELKVVAKDFIDFILSAEGQKVVADSYIPVNENALEYAGNKPSGRIVIGGSSSVAPIMEKLQEAYLKVNPNAKIELQLSDSTTGINSTIEGRNDIGMASRELQESEKSKVQSTKIALDGIAVIVNKNNPIKSLTTEEVRKIYTGKTEKWE